MFGRFAALAALAAALLLAPADLRAQPRVFPNKGKMGRGNPKALPLLERLRRMTPEQRRRFLDNLPPERRRLLEQRLRQFDRMTPEERRRAARSLQDFQSLPQQRRERVRNLFTVFSMMPAERRVLLRKEVQALGDLDAEQRRAHMESDEFREKYSPQERRWLNALSKALYDEDEPEPNQERE